MPCIILAFVVVNLVAAATYIAVLDKAAVRKRPIHIIELVIVYFNGRSFINMNAGFGICYIAVVNGYVGTVVEHNTKTGGVVNLAISDVHIITVVKGNTIGAAVNTETADGDVVFTVIRNGCRGTVSSRQ